MLYNRDEVWNILEQFPKTAFNNLSLTIYNQDTRLPEVVEDVVTYEYFKWFLQRKYGSWFHCYPANCGYPYCAYASLKEAWERFSSLPSNLENWAKLYMSYFYKYNPIENYDRISEVTTTYNGKETSTTDYAGSEKIETSFEGSESNTFTNPENGYTDTTESLRSPEDSANYTPVEKVENKIDHREESTTTSFNDRKNVNNREFDERQDKTEKSFEDRNDIVTEHTHGNIGVSTVADMTMKTLEIIKTNVTDYILDEFAKQYLIYWG